jgi:hypothetical protein
MARKRRQPALSHIAPAPPALTPPPAIDAFTGPYFFLSNFADSPIDFEGHSYPTVEHAFAVAKTLDPTERERIRQAARPRPAVRRALRAPCRDLRAAGV